MHDDYKPSKGCTLLIPSGTSENPEGKHLFIVVTNPCAGICHLLISASTVKPHRAHDPTCLLAPGDHPFIEQQSYIFYARAQQLPQAGIVKCVQGGRYVPKDSCNTAVLKRICGGISASALTPRWAKEYFRINGNR
ncbi:MAG: hypothetical protein WCD52_23200 [Xanthobacteraceae bacterium]